jgi:pimeloyl-ACP methyl ester carboxylesterase
VGVTFGLIHGAWHGAWCWERLLEPLRALGHDAVAMDLPSDDPDAGLDAYADAVAAALDHVDGDVVIVAHSMTGLVLPHVAARRPVRAVVYLAGFVPVAGQSMADQFASSPEPILLFDGGREVDDRGLSHWPDRDATARILYSDLDPADAAWAFAHLRAQAQKPQREPHPESLPLTGAVSIVCSRDRIVNPEWSRRVTRERLGVEPTELDAGHFPMLGAPRALAAALDACVSRGP